MKTLRLYGAGLLAALLLSLAACVPGAIDGRVDGLIIGGTWTLRISPVRDNLVSVTNGNGRFVAVGIGDIFTSP